MIPAYSRPMLKQGFVSSRRHTLAIVTPTDPRPCPLPEKRTARQGRLRPHALTRLERTRSHQKTDRLHTTLGPWQTRTADARQTVTSYSQTMADAQSTEMGGQTAPSGPRSVGMLTDGPPTPSTVPYTYEAVSPALEMAGAGSASRPFVIEPVSPGLERTMVAGRPTRPSPHLESHTSESVSPVDERSTTDWARPASPILKETMSTTRPSPNLEPLPPIQGMFGMADGSTSGTRSLKPSIPRQKTHNWTGMVACGATGRPRSLKPQKTHNWASTVVGGSASGLGHGKPISPVHPSWTAGGSVSRPCAPKAVSGQKTQDRSGAVLPRVGRWFDVDTSSASNGYQGYTPSHSCERQSGAQPNYGPPAATQKRKRGDTPDPDPAAGQAHLEATPVGSR